MINYSGILLIVGYLTVYHCPKCFTEGMSSALASKPNYITLDSYFEDDNVETAVRFLKGGLVIALPTDTVYGLAAIVQNRDAIKQLYKIKGRDSAKPIALCVGEVKDLKQWGIVDHLPPGLLDDLLPGPVTVLLKRTSLIPPLNQGISKIGIRVPDYDFIRKITCKLNTAIALTSANPSNKSSALSTVEFRSLWPYVSAVFDGGKLGDSLTSRAGSTIVDLTVKNKYTLVRNGSAGKNISRILDNYGLVRERGI